MKIFRHSLWSRMRQDRVFWLVVSALLLLYVVLEIRSIFPALLTLAALIVGVTIHECAHAWTAYKLGDPTARNQGRVSLNPIVHLDPLGTVMMVMTLLGGLGIGWGKPVQVSPWRLRYGARIGGGIVALAGPLSNLVLAAGVGLLLRLVLALSPSLAAIYPYIAILVMTNLVLAFFNLLPLPPLDGHAVAVGLFSLSGAQWARHIVEFLLSLTRYGVWLLIGLILISWILPFDLLGILVRTPAIGVYRLIMQGI